MFKSKDLRYSFGEFGVGNFINTFWYFQKKSISSENRFNSIGIHEIRCNLFL
ncbi:MAG: hypothetical protein ACTSO2_00290 [Promethearchaeota archaeon]